MGRSVGLPVSPLREGERPPVVCNVVPDPRKGPRFGFFATQSAVRDDDAETFDG